MAQTRNQLEADGFVTRAESATDRRRTNVTITASGEAELRSYFDGVTRFAAGLLRELGERDSHELVRILGRLADALRDASDAAPEGGEAHEAR